MWGAYMNNETSSEHTTDVDFKDLILGFSGAALHHLGETRGSTGNQETPNFLLARQNIEIISMLFEKTKGNLSPNEEAMIQQVLLDLRVRFIEKSKARAQR